MYKGCCESSKTFLGSNFSSAHLECGYERNSVFSCLVNSAVQRKKGISWISYRRSVAEQVSGREKKTEQ